MIEGRVPAFICVPPSTGLFQSLLNVSTCPLTLNCLICLYECVRFALTFGVSDDIYR